MLVFFLNSDLVDYMDDTINRREKIFISMKKFHSFGLVQFKFCCIFVALSFSKCTFWPFLDVCKIYTNKTIFIWFLWVSLSIFVMIIEFFISRCVTLSNPRIELKTSNQMSINIFLSGWILFSLIFFFSLKI